MQHHLRRLKPAARPISAIFVACLFAVFAAVPQAKAVTDPFTTPGNGSWTAPAGVTSITVECWGAGGGGGGDSVSSTNTNGGGGGGGAYGKTTYAVTPSSSYNFTVGTGGAGGIGTANGSDGANSTFQTTVCVAAGGKGGSSATNSGNGGAGGLASASTGNLYSGGTGSNDVGGGNSGGGGGGGSAGTASNGTSATNSRTGATAVTGGGPGGNGSSNGGNGSAPASGPGGGGGGAKYDTANRNGGAGYDGKIAITYKYATVTTISCGAGPFTYTGSAQTPCTATVTAPDGLNQAVTVVYTGNTNAGTATATANFASTADYLASSANTTFTINKATPTISITNPSVTYNGSPRTATITGSVAGTVSNIKYNGSSTAPTAAGTYAVTANFVPTDGNNYNSLTDASAGNFVINKATPTLSISNSPVTYNTTQQVAAVTGSVAGTVTNILYNSSSTAPTNAGTYAVTANFAPTDATNYNSLTGASAGNFVINKATPTLSVSNTPLTYNAAQQAAAVASSTTGTISNVRYNGSTTVPTNAATYAMTANFLPSDTANYNSLTSASAGNFVINKATPTLTVSNSPASYDGTSKTATVAVTGPAGTVAGSLTNVRYDGSTTAPTNAATYAVTANFAPSDTTNYNSLSSVSAGSFTINQAATTTTVTCTAGPFTYTGSAFTPCSASVTGPGGLNQSGLAVSYANNVNAGTATASATYAGAANYQSSNGSKTFTIGKATPTLLVTNSPVTFDGTAKAATLAANATPGTVAGTFTNVAYNLSATAPTNAGTYAVTTDFTPDDATNYVSLTGASAGNFTIAKAGSTTAVTCDPGPFSYTGAAITPCTATVTGVGGLNEAVGVSYTGNTNAGTATATATYAASTNHLGSTDSTTFTIDKADPTLAVTNSPVPYDGTAKTAVIAASATAGTVLGTLSNVRYDSSLTAPSDVGTYAVTADFTPDDGNNYNSLSNAAAGGFTIAGSPTTTTVTCTGAPFTYTGAAITPCTASVTGPGGLNQVLTVSYSGNVNAGTATAAASFGGSGNYDASSDSTTFTIDQAPTTTTVTCAAGPFTYTGAALEPCSASVTGANGLNQVLTVTYANNIDAGTASAGAGYAGSANYLPSNDSATFAIGKATPVLAVNNSPATFDGTQHAATAAASAPAGAVAGTISGIRYDGSTTAPTNAGSYAVTADFLPDDTANYNSVSGGSAESFVIEKAATTTAVSCAAGPFVFTGSAIEPCTAVATGPAGLNQAVAVVYSANTDAGTASANAGYAGAANYLPSSGSNTFTITKATPTLSLTGAAPTYDGMAKAASVAGSVPGTVSGVKYDGSATEPVNAGTYAVTADFLPADAANYNSLTNVVVGNFTINKADPTLSITNSPAAYDGTPKTANVVGSVSGTVSNLTYNTVGAAPTNSGTYAVNADFVPDDTANYNSLTGASAGNFVIQKAGTPVLSVSNSPLIFNGAAQAATVVGSVPGAVSNILYNGSATVPTGAGSYVITADFLPDDTVNYDTLAGAAAGTLVIEPAATSTAVTCTAGPFTYTGAAITPCTAVVTGPGGLNQALAVVYAGNTNAGTASASATFGATANYLTSSGSTTFTIGKATPSVLVTNSPAAYDGAPKTANVGSAVPGTVSNVRYNGSANAPINAGTYAITADFAPIDTTNYNSLSGAGAGNFVIQKAGTPTLSVSNSPVVFTGAAQAAVVGGSVPGTVSNIRYNGSPTAPVNAGSYVITADFVPNDTVNYDSITGASAGSFTIARAATATTIDCGVGTYTYTGAAITPCTAVVTGTGGLSAAVTVGYSSNVNVGTAAASASYAGDTNYLPSSAAGGFTIAKAATTTVVTCAPGPFTVTGSAIEPCTAVVTGPGGLSQALAVIYADNVGVGTASASASYAGSANYLPSSDTEVFVIGETVQTTVFVHLPFMSK